MSRVRIVVEWCFKGVLLLFSALDFTCTQRSLVSPIGLQDSVAVLLYNAHIGLHNPQISQYFANPNDLYVLGSENESGSEDMPV